MIDWLFRNRSTGRITIAQLPNLPLALFLGALILRWLLDPAGRLRAGLTVVATGALIWWAAEEVLSGVNPWRRLLGGGVLAVQVMHLVTRL